jgi:hypothetical protein
VDEAHEHAVELEAAVEAPGEAGKIARGVRRAELAVGAHDRRLDVAQHGIDRHSPDGLGWRPKGCSSADFRSTGPLV